MTNIRIDNLKTHQVAMLNRMWSFESREQYNEWFETLNPFLQEEAEQLLKVLTLEITEQDMDLFNKGEEDFSEANAVLAKFRLGK